MTAHFRDHAAIILNLEWQESYDEYENSVWTAEGPSDNKWRVKMRLRNSKMEWYEASDSELIKDHMNIRKWPDYVAALVELSNDNEKI